MLGVILALMAVAFVGLAAIAILFVLGMRAKSPLAVDAGRWFTRTVANPSAMRSAGKPGAAASVIRHHGRKSGNSYETPVGAVAIEHGFAIALPYSSRASWVKNVLASGSATIVHEGREYPVDQPEVVPMQLVATCFSPSDRRSFRLFRVDECLRVRSQGSLG